MQLFGCSALMRIDENKIPRRGKREAGAEPSWRGRDQPALATYLHQKLAIHTLYLFTVRYSCDSFTSNYPPPSSVLPTPFDRISADSPHLPFSSISLSLSFLSLAPAPLSLLSA